MLKPLDHKPVLLDEVIEGLAIKPAGFYIDATFGRGGHSEAILAKLGPQGRLLAIDKDPIALQVGQERFGKDTRFSMERGSFAMLNQIVTGKGWSEQVAGILLDLGVSSPQLDNPERGFSFMHDGPLDMRMDPDSGISAADWIKNAKESDIAQVLKQFGEERHARRISRAIVQARQVEPITSTARLAAIASAANPAWEKHKHPATRTFQAIRIFINNELGDLLDCLPHCMETLAIGGRLAVISFHSLEDRIVKRFIRREVQGDEMLRHLPLTQDQIKQRLRSIGRAIKPSEQETNSNPRARSAVLRIAEKLS